MKCLLELLLGCSIWGGSDCLQCTEVRFASFLSGWFITAMVVNSPEMKLEKAALCAVSSFLNSEALRTFLRIFIKLFTLLIWITQQFSFSKIGFIKTFFFLSIYQNNSLWVMTVFDKFYCGSTFFLMKSTVCTSRNLVYILINGGRATKASPILVNGENILWLLAFPPLRCTIMRFDKILSYEVSHILSNNLEQLYHKVASTSTSRLVTCLGL